MEHRRYRQTSGHSRSNSFQEYPPADHRPPSSIVTPTNQIGNSRGRHHPPAPPHLDHHGGGGGHHHLGNHHHKQSREVFDDDGDSSSADNDYIQRDANGGFGDNFEIPHRMLKIIMPELFEHLNESHGEPHLTESVNFSSRYTTEDQERPKQRLDIETIKALNKQRVASLADDAWIYESEEDPNLVRPRRQLYQSR